jgi:hypothetical protein
MATSADQRLLELLEKWLGSLDRHLQYASLDDAAYGQVQDWVEHQRPTRWIIDLARQRTLALKAMLEERIAAGDAGFGDALELSIFLANLVGSQHIERFIPLAEPEPAGAAPPPAARPSRAADSTESSTTATREMPKVLAARPRDEARAGSKPPAVKPSARGSAKPSASKPSAPRPSAPKPPAPAAAPGAAPGTPEAQVLADAARLIQWGRKWYELPELIARMADRPALAEVRRILTDHKALLERQTRSS